MLVVVAKRRSSSARVSAAASAKTPRARTVRGSAATIAWFRASRVLPAAMMAAIATAKRAIRPAALSLERQRAARTRSSGARIA